MLTTRWYKPDVTILMDNRHVTVSNEYEPLYLQTGEDQPRSGYN